nr:MAG TPA: hypothetical protein [Caudoviricetes sp.]
MLYCPNKPMILLVLHRLLCWQLKWIPNPL